MSCQPRAAVYFPWIRRPPRGLPDSKHRHVKLAATVDVGDALIAGIAWANELTIATRNVSDFQDLGVTVTNPWEST